MNCSYFTIIASEKIFQTNAAQIAGNGTSQSEMALPRIDHFHPTPTGKVKINFQQFPPILMVIISLELASTSR